MNNYLLFEVGVEELPSRFVSSTLDQIKSNLTKMFNENRIEFSDIKTYGTPRRLTFIVENISERQSNLEEEVKGPSKKIALDADGNFTKPALGFMKSKGLKEEDVVFKTVGKDEYIFGTIRQEGKETSEVLKTILPEAVKNVTFPKAMRWGGRNMRFARPIRWMVTLLNDNVLEIDLEGIKSSNITKGHRFLGQSEFEVNSLEDYLTKLEENFVILDQDKRKEMIRKQCIEVAKSLGGEVEFDEDLLEEVTYLVEYPTAFYGEFNEDYVKLPKEVVTTPMQQHQRYFPVVKDGKLLPNFIAVRNGNDYRIDKVKAGNEKVLVTGMVFEFTELQGIMGREYARVSGENEAVCEAIFEHYLPRFAGDILPKTNAGIALSIADKLDSIAGFFAIGIQPTGSQDPYALRRQALGVLNILMDSKLDISLKELVELALNNYSNLEFNKEEVVNSIMEFFKERIKNLFRDLGIRYDVIDAVLSSEINDISDMHLRATELNNWLDKDELVEMLTAFNRVSTLAQKAVSSDVNEQLLTEDAEINLYKEFNNIKVKVKELLNDKKYSEALDSFASLRPSIDAMFDSVMVMDKDEAIKNNRLGLLKQIYDTMLSICDLSKIVYK